MVRTVASLTVVLLCVAAPGMATAQPQQKPPEPRGALLIGLYTGYAVSQGLDIHSTVLARSVGLKEGNEFMRGCVESMTCMVAVKSVVTGGVIWLIDQAVRPQSKAAAISTMITLNLLQGFVSGQNYSMYFGVKRRLQ